MSGIPALSVNQSTPDAYTKVYSATEKVPESVLDVAPVSQNSGSFVANDVLEGVSTYNKLLYMSQHTAWDDYATKFGQEAADKAKAADSAGIAQFGQNLIYEAGVAGIGVSSAGNSDDSSGQSSSSATPARLSVDNKDYTSDTSAYSISASSDGIVSVSKNGKSWRNYDGMNLIASVQNSHLMLPGEIATQLLARKGPVLSKTA